MYLPSHWVVAMSPVKTHSRMTNDTRPACSASIFALSRPSHQLNIKISFGSSVFELCFELSRRLILNLLGPNFVEQLYLKKNIPGDFQFLFSEGFLMSASLSQLQITRRRVHELFVVTGLIMLTFSVSCRAFVAPSALRRPVHLAASHRTGSQRAPRVAALFSTTSSSDIDELKLKIQTKGDEIRQLKADGIEKDKLAPHVAELIALKSQLPSEETGEEQNKPAESQKKQSSTLKQQPSATSAPPIEELSERELRLSRLSKAHEMKAAGVEPFAYTYHATHKAAELAAAYEGKLEPGEEDDSVEVSIAGRIMIRRVFGKLAFFTLQDDSGTIQLQFDKNRLGDSFKVSEYFPFLLRCANFVAKPARGTLI